MKKAFLILFLLALSLSLYAEESIEVGTGAAYNNTQDRFPKPFADVTYTLDRFSFYLDYKYEKSVTGYAEYLYDKGIWNHQVDLTTRYIFTEGGFSSLAYMFIVNLEKSGFYCNLGAGVSASLSYSEYSNIPLFMLLKMVRVRLGYRGDAFSACLFLESNYRYEREWNPKAAAGISLGYNITPRDTVTLDVAATSCEILMDPYRIFYSARVRAGYRRVL